jgi:diguanylate cyclase (GGDEF)-like protein
LALICATQAVAGPLLLSLIVFETVLLTIEDQLARDLGRQASGVSPSTLLAYAGAFLISPGYILLHVLLRLSLNELFRPSASAYRWAYIAVRISLAWLPAILILSAALRVMPVSAPAVLALTLVCLSLSEFMTEHWIMPREAGPSSGAHLYLARVSSGTVGVLFLFQLYLWDGPIGIALFSLAMATLLGGATRISRKCQQAVDLARAETERRKSATDAVQDRRLAVEKLAYSDTFIEGLGNRRRFERDLGELGSPDDALLVLGDVSGLKVINDARGHPTGDLLLAAVGRALYSVSRDHGLAYHFPGGDEYALLIERFPRERIGALLADIDAQVAAEVAKTPELSGVRIWLRTGWAHGQPNPVALRAKAEAMLTERWGAEKRAGLGGRA